MRPAYIALTLAVGIGAGGCAFTTTVVRDEEPIPVRATPPAAPSLEGVAVAVTTPVVRIEKERIVVDDKIHFEHDSATIKAESHNLLNQIAQVLKDNPHVKKVRIEGHTDDTGTAAYNKKLSKERAAAVRDYLVAQGIEAARLTAEGLGQTRPIADNATDEGKAKNRRVEFHITDQGAAGTAGGDK